MAYRLYSIGHLLSNSRLLSLEAFNLKGMAGSDTSIAHVAVNAQIEDTYRSANAITLDRCDVGSSNAVD